MKHLILARALILAASLLAAVCTGALLLLVTGFDPLHAFGRMLQSAFGSPYALIQTLQQTTPILLCALGIAVPAKLSLWNIGAEGQFYVGALAATGTFLAFPDLPAPLLVPAMAIASMAAGLGWIALPAILRVYWNVSEILTTLMFNYIALPLVNYLLYGPWRSPTAFNFPVTRRFTSNAFLPLLPGFPVHVGVVVAVCIAIAIHLAINRTSAGFRLRVTGDNRRAARYSGYRVRVIEMTALGFSGAMSGLAGMVQVAGVTHQMLPNLSLGVGYTGIIVASLAFTNIPACVLLSFLFSVLTVGSQGVESIGVPSGIANFFSGIVLIFLLIGVALSRRSWRFSGLRTLRGKANG